jgi:hypothetical protein
MTKNTEAYTEGEKSEADFENRLPGKSVNCDLFVI